MKKIFVFVFILFFCSTTYSWEAKFKQKAELFIVDGKIKKGEPHAYVTLDIQNDKVIYKEIEDWKSKTKESTGGVFQIVSQGKTLITHSETRILNKIKAFSKTTPPTSEYVIRAVYHGGESVNFLIIGETFLLEVKNSVFFGNAINYAYYESIKK